MNEKMNRQWVEKPDYLYLTRILFRWRNWWWSKGL